MSMISDTLRHVLQKIASGDTPPGFERTTTSLSKTDAERILFLDSFYVACQVLADQNRLTPANVVAAMYPGSPGSTIDLKS